MFINELFEDSGDDLFGRPRGELGAAISKGRWAQAAELCIKSGYRNPQVEQNIIPGIIKSEGRAVGNGTWYLVRDWYNKFIAPNDWPELIQYVTTLKTKGPLNAALTHLVNFYADENPQHTTELYQIIVNKKAVDALVYFLTWPGQGRAVRIPEMEPYIMTNPRAAMYYAAKVINGRWPEAEPYIATDKISWSMYAARSLGTNNGTVKGRDIRDQAQQEALRRLPDGHKKRIAEEDDMFAPSQRTKAQTAIKAVLDSNYNRYQSLYDEADPENSENWYVKLGEYLSDYDYLRSELARGGIPAFLNGLDMVSTNVLETVDSDLAIKHKIYLNQLDDQYAPLDEDTDEYDDDMFASSDRVSNTQALSKIAAQLSNRYLDYARTATDDESGDLYASEAHALERASNAFMHGLRAGFSELEAVEDPTTWEDLGDLCAKQGIDLSELADKSDAGELSESDEDDDLFAQSKNAKLGKLSTDQLRMLYSLSKSDSRAEYASAHKLQMARIDAELTRRGVTGR